MTTGGIVGGFWYDKKKTPRTSGKLDLGVFKLGVKLNRHYQPGRYLLGQFDIDYINFSKNSKISGPFVVNPLDFVLN